MTRVLATVLGTLLLGAGTAAAPNIAVAGGDPAVVGSIALPDTGKGDPATGQGGHGGFAIMSDGTLRGGGHVSLFNGTEEGDVTSGRWNFTAGTRDHIDVQLDVVVGAAGKDPMHLFPHTFTFPNLPVNTHPFFLSEHGFNTLFVIRLRTAG